MSYTRVDEFFDRAGELVAFDANQRAMMESVIHALFENADLEVARSPKDYGIGYIKERYSKFRDEFFGGDNGFLPADMEFGFHKKTRALGTCVTNLVTRNVVFGQMYFVRCKIMLSESYDMSRKTLDEVLIHEMIHADLAYEGAKKDDLDLIKCQHGAPFLAKCREINSSSDYTITVANDDALTLNEGAVNRVLKDNTVLVTVMDARPGKTAVSRVRRPDIGWFSSRMKNWLGKEPEVFECHDANFMNKFPIRRERVGAAMMPSQTIQKMIDDNILRKVDSAEFATEGPYAGCIVAAKPSTKDAGYMSFSVIGNEQDAELLVTKQWACAKMLAKMKGQDESDLDTAKYKRYRATGKFNGWSGRPCKSKFLVTNAPVDQFQKWLLDGALVEDGKFAVYP